MCHGLLPTGSIGRQTATREEVTLAALAAALYAAVDAYANHLQWTTTQPIEWIAHVMLNAIALSVILHVAIGRRWPFGRNAVR